MRKASSLISWTVSLRRNLAALDTVKKVPDGHNSSADPPFKTLKPLHLVTFPKIPTYACVEAEPERTM